MMLRVALLCGLLLPGPPVWGQTSPAAPTAQAAPGSVQAHRLAAAFLEKMQAPTMMSTLLGETRQNIVAIIVRNGKTEQQAEEIFDEFMLPEFRRRLPELMANFEDILVQDFTVAELRAIVDDTSGPARASAAAKAPRLAPEFRQAGEAWGRRVGTDVFTKNADTLKKLGLDFGTPPR